MWVLDVGGFSGCRVVESPVEVCLALTEDGASASGLVEVATHGGRIELDPTDPPWKIEKPDAAALECGRLSCEEGFIRARKGSRKAKGPKNREVQYEGPRRQKGVAVKLNDECTHNEK